MNHSDENREMIVEGFCKAGDVGVLGAPPKTFKTAAVLDLAIAAAASHIATQTWFGYRCMPFVDEEFGDSGRVVLYLNCENPADENRARIRSVLAARGLTADDVKGAFYTLDLKDDEASWNPDALWDRVREFHRKYGHDVIDLIIVDPVYMLIDGDENSNQAMAKFLSQEIGALRDEYSAAVIFTHHFVKSWGSIKNHADRIAGAGTISRYPEVIATLTPAKGGRVALNVTARRHDCYDVTGRLYRFEGARFVECDSANDSPDVDPLEAATRAAFDELSTAGPVRVQALADKLGKHRATMHERVKKYGYTVTKGVVQRPVGG